MAGGGTGGHLFPAIAIAQAAIQKINAEIAFVGRKNSIESKKIPDLKWPFYSIDIQGFSRKMEMKNFSFPVKVVKSLIASRKIIKEYEPDMVIGTGGYVSGPPVYMANRMGIFTGIQEQNSFPGATSKILGKKVNAIYTGFEEANKYFNSEICHYTGNPVRKDINTLTKEEGRDFYKIPQTAKVVLVFGGSQGSVSINRNLAQILDDLVELKDIFVIWQTGLLDYNKYAEHWSGYKNIRILSFIDNMAMAYAAADMAITRSGALTLAELALVGLPAILIPFPYASEDHQMHNARSFEKKGAAIVIQDNWKYSQELLEKTRLIYGNIKLATDMSYSIKQFAIEDAAEQIITSLHQLWEERN